MTNDQAYRALLLEWFDNTSQHPMMGMASLSAPRMQELRHLIETCRPATDSDPAQDVVLAKLSWEKPKSDTRVSTLYQYGLNHQQGTPLAYAVKAFSTTGWAKGSR